jgi:hypothetical protein
MTAPTLDRPITEAEIEAFAEDLNGLDARYTVDDLHGLPEGGPQPDGSWIGYTVPRVWTRPLRPLTEETTLGFSVIRWAEGTLGLRLLPWQKWWLIHALELAEDPTEGMFRFSILLTLIARQNGKTFLLKVVSLYFLYVMRVNLVLGCAQDLTIARESWDGAYDLAAVVPALSAEFVLNPRRRPGRRDGAGYESIVLTPNEGSVVEREYRVSAATKTAGRGLSTDLLIMDEFRHCTPLAWAALAKTTSARPDSIILPITNAGTDDSDVLNGIRAAAIAGVAVEVPEDEDEPGDGEEIEPDSIGIFEWSAPDGCPIFDRDGNCHANPALGYGMLTKRKLAAFRRADPSAAVYRTESLCQRQQALDILIAPERWKHCRDAQLSLASVRARTVLVFEVSPDGQHATLVSVAKFEDGRYGIDVVSSWTDLKRAESELLGHVERVRAKGRTGPLPGSFGWFPDGPAAQFAAMLRKIKGQREIKGKEVTEACMTLVGLINRLMIRHGEDPLLTAHIIGARKLEVADGYRFVRKGAGHVDAAYAAAGGVMLAEALPPPPKTSGVWVV